MSFRGLGGFVGVAGLVTSLFVASLEAQVTLTGTNYTQNFNSISNGLPPGWSVRTNATATSLGTAAAFNTTNISWGTQAGQFANCAGAVANNGTNFFGDESPTIQGSCTNRALAIRQTAAFGDPGAAFVFQIANTTGFSNFTFSVDLSLLKSNSNSTTWTIDYAVGDSPASFTLLGTNSDPGNFSTTNRTFTLGTDADSQPNNVWIRIAALSADTAGGTRDTFGMDNFSLSWTANNQPVVAPVTPAIAAMVMNGGNVQIDFQAGTSDVSSAFLVVRSAQIAGTYTDAGAIITSLGSGSFRATCAANDPQQFYRIKRP
jgi:hypothetical protein